jgi:anti-sigma B factor antagonist
MASAVIESPRDIHLSASPVELGPGLRCLLDEPGVLYVCGEVDLWTAEELRTSLHVLAMDSSPIVTIDLASVTFMSCAGLAALVEARRRLGRRLRLRAVSPAVRRMLRLAGLTAYFGVHALPGATRY